MHAVRISEGGARGPNHKVPKLPVFADGTDELDNYLRRFERFATNSGWKETEWASYLSALLTSRALDVYSRLPDSAAADYKQLKQALLKRYTLTDEGHRLKFRQERPERDESPSQFIARLLNYVKKWMSLAEVDDTSPAQVRDLFVREQFLEACPQDLAAFLREKPLKSLEEVTETADRFLRHATDNFA